jgi:hypothetical protein
VLISAQDPYSSPPNAKPTEYNLSPVPLPSPPNKPFLSFTILHTPSFTTTVPKRLRWQSLLIFERSISSASTRIHASTLCSSRSLSPFTCENDRTYCRARKPTHNTLSKQYARTLSSRTIYHGTSPSDQISAQAHEDLHLQHHQISKSTKERIHDTMYLPTLTSLLLFPLLALAQSSGSTTTLTSTSTMTKTLTVSQVVASVTSTLSNNTTTSVGPTAVSASVTPVTSTQPTSTIPANFMGAGSSLNGAYAGGAGLVVMIAAALL